MRRILVKTSASVAVLFILLISIAGDGGHAGDDASTCAGCHSGAKAASLGLKDIYAELKAFRYRHKGVEENCDTCHIIKAFKSGRTWELSAVEAEKEEVFFLGGLSANRNYQIELAVKDLSGSSATTAVSFIPSELKDYIVENDFKPPLISDVAVEDIVQSVFIEAELHWTTDKPTNAEVVYGQNIEYGDRTVSDKVFSRNHGIRISGLKPSTVYRYRITSRDIYGNANVSEVFTLDTSQARRPVAAKRHIPDGHPIVKDVRLFRVKGTGGVYLQFLADRPVKARLLVTEPSELDQHGFGFTPKRHSHITVCVKCHSQGISHPVGIRSKGPKTRMAAAFPTIEGGMLTCVTCHEPHGGMRRHFGRLDDTSGLCVVCHTEGAV